MPYDVTLVSLSALVGGWHWTGTATDMFPAGPFSTMVYSQWSCSGTSSSSWSAIAPNFIFNFGLAPNGGAIYLGAGSGGLGGLFNGTFGPRVIPGERSHILLSVDTQAQIVQVYVNDRVQTITGTWTGPGWLTGTTEIDFNIENSASGVAPGIADIWYDVPPAFVDLSLTANRRKFINADLTPVYLGPIGASPFGRTPRIYCTAQTGGVAADILTNLGTGPDFTLLGGLTLAFQTPGVCSLPTPPPPPTGGGGGGGGGPLRLAIDNVIATALGPQPEVNLISLRWSDDRGHSWGSPVTQDIGEAGEYRTSLQWQRCGFARDRCWEISWSVPMHTALQGAWIDVTPAQS